MILCADFGDLRRFAAADFLSSHSYADWKCLAFRAEVVSRDCSYILRLGRLGGGLVSIYERSQRGFSFFIGGLKVRIMATLRTCSAMSANEKPQKPAPKTKLLGLGEWLALFRIAVVRLRRRPA